MKIPREALSLNTLKEDFKVRFDQAKETEKESVIVVEIKAVKNSFEQRFTLVRKEIKVEMVNATFNADYEAFIDYLELWGHMPNLTSSSLQPETALQKQNGVTLARYYEFLLHTREEHLFGSTDIDDDEIAELNDEEEKLAKKVNVRMQLQMLHFLGSLEKIKNTGTVEKKGAFLSPLLLRSPQRARKPFSSKSILFDKDKAEAKNIRRDLEKVYTFFYDLGLTDEASEIKEAIAKINKVHFPEDL